VSYSLYLWHWPVLSFAQYIYGEGLSVPQQLIAVAIMILLTLLSYFFIEQATRKSNKTFLHILVRQFVVPTVGIAMVSVSFILTNGYGLYDLNKEYKVALAKSNMKRVSAGRQDYICANSPITKADINKPDCVINADNQTETILWGDSHAAHFVGTLGEISEEQNTSFKNLIHWACPPVLFAPERFAEKHQRNNCATSLSLVIGEIEKYDTILLAGQWGRYLEYGDTFTDALYGTVKTLALKNKNIVILGDIPRVSSFDNLCQQKTLKLPWLNCTDRFSVDEKETTKINLVIKKIASQFEAAHYIDFNRILCSEGQCSPFIGNKIVYFDSGHLSMNGSVLLGEKARKTVYVSEFFSQYLPKLKNGTTTKNSLPWKSVTIKSSLFMNVDHYPYLISSENLISEKQRWSGHTLNLVNNNDKLWLRVMDNDSESYQFASTRLNVNSLVREKSGGKSLIVSFLLMSGNRNSQFSLLRVRLKDKDDVVKDFDLMVNTNSMIYQTMGALRNDSALMKHEEDGVVATMVIPVPEKLETASIMVYPSVGQNLMQYNKRGIGEISIEKISVHLAGTPVL